VPQLRLARVVALSAITLLILLLAPLEGCAWNRGPSDDEIIMHAKTIVVCNARLTIQRMAPLNHALQNPGFVAGVTPLPTIAPRDPHTLRLCYIGTVATQSALLHPEDRGVVLAAGRACEHLIDTNSDSAMGDYYTCVEEGEESAPRSAGSPTNSP
jgi:hypothetical protein